MNKDKILKDYLEYKKLSVSSTDKLRDLERYTERFLKSSKKKAEDFGESEVINFINSLNGTFSIASINNLKANLKNFIKWFYEDYSTRFRNLDKICRTQQAPKPYSPEQMLSIKEVKKLVSGEKDLMWKVYLLVFFYGCFRPSEAIKLKWEQVFFEPKGTIIKTYSKKNNKTFYKSIPEDVTHFLREWRKVNDNEWVFPSTMKEGEHIHRKTIYHRIKKLAKRVLNKDISPYVLRHSVATIKYNDDSLKDDDVANQMGHSTSMKNTYTNLSEEKIKARARKIWKTVKELTPEEKDKVKKLEKELEEMRDKFKDIEWIVKLKNKFENPEIIIQEEGFVKPKFTKKRVKL